MGEWEMGSVRSGEWEKWGVSSGEWEKNQGLRENIEWEKKWGVSSGEWEKKWEMIEVGSSGELEKLGVREVGSEN